MSTWVLASLPRRWAYVGNVERPIEGLAGEEDGARAAGKDGPLVLDGELLVDELADEHARRFAVRAAKETTPLRSDKDAGVEANERQPLGRAAGCIREPRAGRRGPQALGLRRESAGAWAGLVFTGSPAARSPRK